MQAGQKNREGLPGALSGDCPTGAGVNQSNEKCQQKGTVFREVNRRGGCAPAPVSQRRDDSDLRFGIFLDQLIEAGARQPRETAGLHDVAFALLEEMTGVIALKSVFGLAPNKHGRGG